MCVRIHFTNSDHADSFLRYNCGHYNFCRMVEDHPRCRVEMVERCDDEKKETNHHRDCLRVPAMRCRIEQRTVTKSKPETRCERVPRQFCRKELCSNIDEARKKQKQANKCFYRNKIVSED